MAPATKGLSLFGSSSKKTTKGVDGDMIVKKDTKTEAASPAVGKEEGKTTNPTVEAKKIENGVKIMAPHAVTKLEETKQDTRKSDSGLLQKQMNPEITESAKQEPEKPVKTAKDSADKAPTASSGLSAAIVPPAPPIPAAMPAAAVTPKPVVATLGHPAPIALPLAAEAAAAASAKSPYTTLNNSGSSDATPTPAEVAAAAAPAAPAANKTAPRPVPVAPPMMPSVPLPKPVAPPPAPVPVAAVPVAAFAPAPATQPRINAPTAPAAVKTSTIAEPQLPVTKIRAEDARAAWQTHPRVPVRLLDSYVNFMMVGESGLGKTTFIRNLVSSYTTTGKPHDGSSTSLASFQSDPDSLKTVLEPMEVVEAGRRVHIAVQDMPGWADDINLVYYLRTIVKFILQQRMQDYEALAGGRALNKEAMCGQLQSSVTACLYFLTPHRLKRVDQIMISALSQLVTVIPVIAKADTMTDSELTDYRKEIRARLLNPSKYIPSKNLVPLEFHEFTFDESIMTTLGLTAEAWPLAIITSNKQEPIADPSLLSQLGLSETAVTQPVREYKWGAAYALNREHSDLIILKRLLLGDRVNSLYAMLDASYEKYVAFCQQYEDSGKQLPLVVQEELSAAAYLEYDDYTNAKSALDAAQQAMSTLMAENKALVERLQALEQEKERSSNGGARRF